MIIKLSELSALRHEHRGQAIGLRFGCYDILHAGHQRGVDFVGKHTDLTVIGVMPDEYVRKHKGDDRPINGEQTRVEAIDKAEGVDYSFIAEGGRLALAGVMLRLRPDVYIEDAEYGASKIRAAFLSIIGTEYVIDDTPHPGSSSAMIAELGAQEAQAYSNLSYMPI